MDAAAVMKERDALAEKVRHLEAEAARKLPVSADEADDPMSEGEGRRLSAENLPIGLVRKLAEKQEEIISRLQV